MNRSEFINMVKSGGWDSTFDISNLDEIISMFPWFQSVYTLKLDAYSSSDSISFAEELKKNAIYIANREVLYYILKDTKEHLAVDSIRETEVTDSIPIKQLESQADGKSTDGLRSREDLVSEIEERLAEIRGDKPANDSDTDELNRKVDASQFNHNLDEILILDDIIEETTLQSVSDNAFLSDDLLNFDNPEEEVLKAVKPNDLVDKFIELKPRIEPDRALMEKEQENIADLVDDMSPGLITETLAKIYVNQQFYTKAILIYEKLILKFPEKSSYFATQIERIKELMS